MKGMRIEPQGLPKEGAQKNKFTFIWTFSTFGLNKQKIHSCVLKLKK